MHSESNSFGFSNVRPCEFYSYLFPPDSVQIERLAYFFENDPLESAVNIESVSNAVLMWDKSSIELFAEIGPDHILITKSEQKNVVKVWHLDSLASLIFMLTDEDTHINSIQNKLLNLFSREAIQNSIGYLCAENLLLQENMRYLNIVPFRYPTQYQDIQTWIHLNLKHLEVLENV